MERGQLLLAVRGMTMENILVTTRELLGCDLAEAHRAMHTHRGHFAVVLGEPTAAL
ncbi:hypothetical protein ACGF12_35750 [Kitasatospora sp. NPDC048296]|uniref:hypothetical protein n=1 Tax=Kitasatospora sp. NPDC048296 TaxID=3364048 RepID=UPI003711D184